MIGALVVLCWACVAVLAWVYAGYPVVATLYGRLRPIRVAPDASAIETVTVGLAVHNGAEEVAERIADVIAQVVPFAVEVVVASDGSTDDTGAVVSELQRAEGRIQLLDLPRCGQSAAQARVFEQARTDVVVLTDVQTRFAPGALAALVGPLADSRVGCVTGILRWDPGGRTSTARHEGLYWRYEQYVRAVESRAGWLAAGTGALLAVRQSLYRPTPAHASLDQMLPLYARTAGLLVLVAPDAVGRDRATATPMEQLASRTRIATQGIEANLRMARHVAPWRQPGLFMALWSHKILRWATPYLALAAAVAGLAGVAAGAGYLYAAPAAGLAAIALLAGADLLGRRMGRPLPGVGIGLTIAVVNVAFAQAWINVLLRRRISTWPSASETDSEAGRPED